MSCGILYVQKSAKGETTEELLCRCAEAFLQVPSGSIRASEVTRSGHGKPALVGYPVEVSVSHSGDVFAALVADRSCGPVGLDIQFEKQIRYLNVAKRFFSDAEYRYVARTGILGFYKVWTRKEALTKYLGLPLGHTLQRYTVADENGLLETAGGAHFIDFEIDSGLAASIAADACCKVNTCREERNITQF